MESPERRRRKTEAALTELTVLFACRVADPSEILGHSMFDEGLEIHSLVATSNKEFVEALESRAIDAVVIEAMSGGIDALHIVRERRPVTPVLMIADFEHIDAVLEAKQLGLERYVFHSPDNEDSQELIVHELESMLAHVIEPPSVEMPSAEALHRYAQFYNVPDPFIVVSPQERLIYANEAARRMSREHFDTEIWVGAPVDKWQVELDANQFRANLRAALGGERRQASQHLGDIQETFQRIVYEPVLGPDERVLAVSIAAQNRTELRTVELRLEKGYEQAIEIFDTMPLPLALIAPDGEVRRANAAFCDLLDVSGRPSEQFDLSECIDDQQLDTLHDKMARVRDGPRNYFFQEVHFETSEGRDVWGEMTGLPARGLGAPNTPDWLCFVVDISAHKATEQKLQRSLRLQALGELAGGVAHDFNNILGIVVTYAEMLQLQRSSPPDSQRDTWLEKILDAVERGRTLTHQLLTFSRHQDAEKQLVQPNDMVRDLVELVGRIIGANIELEVDLDPSLPSLQLNRAQFEQVLMNLVVNARDAMPEGGRLEIRTSVDQVDPGSRAAEAMEPGRYVVLSIGDTGHGMDHETQEKIFEPFFTTKSKGRGTGLGLATVYGIVEDAGGTIYVESEPGAGTNMILYWPTSHQSSREAAPEAKPPTLMIVEDQDDLREPFCQFFSSHSFRVVAAASVSEALDKYDHSDTIDVLITDIVLPDGSGLDLSDRLAQRQPELDVVLMSGYVAELREERKGLSTRVYLPKPVSLSELKTAVDDLTRH